MAMTSSSIFAFCTRMLRVPGSHAQSFVPDQHVSKLHFGARTLLPVHLSSFILLSELRSPMSTAASFAFAGSPVCKSYKYKCNANSSNNKSVGDAVSAGTCLLAYKWLKLCSPLKLQNI